MDNFGGNAINTYIAQCGHNVYRKHEMNFNTVITVKAATNAIKKSQGSLRS